MPNTKPPWQLTRGEWNAARAACASYGAYTSKPTNSCANEMLARITALEQLLFGANDRARSIILANANARAVGAPLPHSARKMQWARQKLDTYITHRDVTTPHG